MSETEKDPNDIADTPAGDATSTATDEHASIQAAPGAASPPEEAHDPLSELRAEFDALNDRHLRLAAEFTNFRRRAEQEQMGAWSRGQAELVKKLLDVLDDLQRVAALDPADEATTVEQVVEGIDLVERKFVTSLQNAGVQMIDPAPGAAFDPARMEAMMRVPAGDAAQDDTVAQVFAKGYDLDGTLIRPARVSVFKAD